VHVFQFRCRFIRRPILISFRLYSNFFPSSSDFFRPSFDRALYTSPDSALAFGRLLTAFPAPELDSDHCCFRLSNRPVWVPSTPPEKSMPQSLCSRHPYPIWVPFTPPEKSMSQCLCSRHFVLSLVLNLGLGFDFNLRSSFSISILGLHPRSSFSVFILGL